MRVFGCPDGTVQLSRIYLRLSVCPSWCGQTAQTASLRCILITRPCKPYPIVHVTQCATAVQQLAVIVFGCPFGTAQLPRMHLRPSFHPSSCCQTAQTATQRCMFNNKAMQASATIAVKSLSLRCTPLVAHRLLLFNLRLNQFMLVRADDSLPSKGPHLHAQRWFFADCCLESLNFVLLRQQLLPLGHSTMQSETSFLIRSTMQSIRHACQCLTICLPVQYRHHQTCLTPR